MGGGREKEANSNGANGSASTENGEKRKRSNTSDSERKSPAGDRKSPDRSVDLVRPPDGGWGWMVVFGSFMIHVIADGIVYSFGIFYMEFLHYYKGGKGETAWVGSLVPGVTLTVGPLASIITNKYGCRVTTMVGAIIASAGFVLSLFAPNLYFLYFSFGIMAGLGFGLIYLPAIVIVGYYFEERRAFATGLAVCGSGLGAFIFNPLSKFLIDEYGWRGAILIEAGIILNCVLCGALFRPLVGPKMSECVDGDSDKNSSSAPKGRELKSVKDALEMELLISNNVVSNGGGDSDVIDDLTDFQITSTPSSPKKTELALFTDQNNSPALFRSEGSIHKAGTRTLPVSPLARDQSNKPPQMKRLLSEDNTRAKPLHHSHRHLTPGAIYLSGSLLNVSLHRSHPAMYIASLTSIQDLRAADGTDGRPTRSICGISVPAGIFYTLKQMVDFSLLKDPIFLMFVISNFFTSIGFNMPFIFLTDRAVDEGTSEENAKWLVSAIGMSNTVGRVLFGFLADKKGVNRLSLYNTALTICGIATALCPLAFNYPLLMLYASVFGLFIGVYVSLTSVVLVDLLGLEMLTSSFGLLLMFQGFATLIGPPIAGWLYDGTGSYDVSFIVAGVMVAFSGFMLFFIPLVRRCHSKNSLPVDDDPDVEINITANADRV